MLCKFCYMSLQVMLEANYFNVRFISPQYQNWFLNFGYPLYIFHYVLWLLNILVKTKFTFIGLSWSAVLISLVYRNCLREYCGLVDQEALEGSTISHQVVYQAWCRVLGSTPPLHKSSPCPTHLWIDTRPIEAEILSIHNFILAPVIKEQPEICL